MLTQDRAAPWTHGGDTGEAGGLREVWLCWILQALLRFLF